YPWALSLKPISHPGDQPAAAAKRHPCRFLRTACIRHARPRTAYGLRAAVERGRGTTDREGCIADRRICGIEGDPPAHAGVGHSFEYWLEPVARPVLFAGHW